MAARKPLVLAICCLSLFIVGLDATIVNLALPSIRHDLDASVTGLQWTVDAYTLVLAALLVLSGSTADRIGRRRTFQAGLVLFSVGSLLCSIEPRREDPLLDLRFFRSVPFSGTTVIAVRAFASLGGFLFLNSIHLQETRGFTALHAGLPTLPMAAMTAVFAPLSGRVVGAWGTRVPLLLAGVGLTTAGLLLTTITPTSPIPLLVVAYAAFGIGFGMVNAPITNTAASGMPVQQAGVAAAIASTSRQVGAALGVALIGALTGWWIIAACGTAITALGLVTTSQRALKSVL